MLNLQSMLMNQIERVEYLEPSDQYEGYFAALVHFNKADEAWSRGPAYRVFYHTDPQYNVPHVDPKATEKEHEDAIEEFVRQKACEYFEKDLIRAAIYIEYLMPGFVYAK